MTSALSFLSVVVVLFAPPVFGGPALVVALALTTNDPMNVILAVLFSPLVAVVSNAVAEQIRRTLR